MKKIFLLALAVGYCANTYSISRDDQKFFTNFVALYSIYGAIFYGGAIGGSIYFLSAGKYGGSSYGQAFATHALAGLLATAIIHSHIAKSYEEALEKTPIN
jgi:hypothetical protein